LRSRLAFVEEQAGSDGLRRVLESLPAADQAACVESSQALGILRAGVPPRRSDRSGGRGREGGLLPESGRSLGGEKPRWRPQGLPGTRRSSRLSAPDTDHLFLLLRRGAQEYSRPGRRRASSRLEAETFSASDCLTVVGWHRKALEMCGASNAASRSWSARARGAAVCRYRVRGTEGPLYGGTTCRRAGGGCTMTQVKGTALVSTMRFLAERFATRQSPRSSPACPRGQSGARPGAAGLRVVPAPRDAPADEAAPAELGAQNPDLIKSMGASPPTTASRRSTGSSSGSAPAVRRWREHTRLRQLLRPGTMTAVESRDGHAAVELRDFPTGPRSSATGSSADGADDRAVGAKNVRSRHMPLRPRGDPVCRTRGLEVVGSSSDPPVPQRAAPPPVHAVGRRAFRDRAGRAADSSSSPGRSSRSPTVCCHATASTRGRPTTSSTCTTSTRPTLDCLCHLHLPLWSPRRAPASLLLQSFTQFSTRSTSRSPLRLPRRRLHAPRPSVLSRPSRGAPRPRPLPLAQISGSRQGQRAPGGLCRATSFRVFELFRFPNAVHTAAWLPWIPSCGHANPRRAQRRRSAPRCGALSGFACS